MANFNTIEELVASLSENPTALQLMRTTVLTRELIELPERFAQFSQDTRERLDALERLVEHSIQRLDALERLVEHSIQRLEVLERRLEILEGHMDRLRGSDMEMRLQGRVHGLLGGSLDLYRVRVVRATIPSVTLTRFSDVVEDAREHRTITNQQHRRIMDTDLIASARRDGSTQQVYVAIEAASRLDRDDVKRVGETGGSARSRVSGRGGTDGRVRQRGIRGGQATRPCRRCRGIPGASVALDAQLEVSTFAGTVRASRC